MQRNELHQKEGTRLKPKAYSITIQNPHVSSKKKLEHGSRQGSHSKPPVCNAKKLRKPAGAIYDTPTAQRKVIDQRVIAGPSKTSHQQGNKQYTSVTNNKLCIRNQ